MFRRLAVTAAASLLSLGLAGLLLSATPIGSAWAQGSPESEPPSDQRPEVATEGEYTIEEISEKAADFFGEMSQGLAEVIQRAFEEQGRPNGYIAGQEIAGAFFVGLRYGDGMLHRKTGEPVKVFWQGPSIGWDLGGNAAKAFTLVYNLDRTDGIFQRFPGVDGSLYFIAGFGLNYQQQGDIILAPIRTGVGLRAGANVGWLHYTPERRWVPF